MSAMRRSTNRMDRPTWVDACRWQSHERTSACRGWTSKVAVPVHRQNAGPLRPAKGPFHRARPARFAPALHALTNVVDVYAVVVPAAAKTRDDIAGVQQVTAAPTRTEPGQ
jgi:hypothetical protein